MQLFVPSRKILSLLQMEALDALSKRVVMMNESLKERPRTKALLGRYGCFFSLPKSTLSLRTNAIAVDSSFPRFGIHFASKCVCCSSPCIERVDHLSQSDIARIDNRVSFLSQSQCGLILESSSLHHLLASWFNGAKSKSQGGNKAADCLAAYGHTHSDSILFNSLGSLPFDSKKPVHSQGINSESETIVLCRVREEIEHGILTGRSAKPGSLSVVRKEAPMIEKGKTISKWKCLKLLLDRNERDSELADPYTQMADIEKMVLPTSQPKKIDPGILEEGRKYLPTNRVEWAGAGRVLSVLQGPKKNDSPIEKMCFSLYFAATKL
ncbi:hypothetical protein Tco_0129289 [Tanacetum coccineum]